MRTNGAVRRLKVYRREKTGDTVQDILLYNGSLAYSRPNDAIRCVAGMLHITDKSNLIAKDLNDGSEFEYVIYDRVTRHAIADSDKHRPGQLPLLDTLDAKVLRKVAEKLDQELPVSLKDDSGDICHCSYFDHGTKRGMRCPNCGGIIL